MKEVRASIDIGSNSTLLLIMNSNTREILEEHSTITSLGKDLDKNGIFLDTTMESTYNALKSYCEICNKYKIEATEIIATATEASRVATNASIFFTKVKKELGLTIQIITGAGEAYYTAFGIAEMLQSSSDKSAVIMDVGGASTELISISLDNFEIKESVSLPVGSVRTTDWINEGIADNKFSDAFKSIDFSAYKNQKVICVAGTMTTLALMMANSKNFDRDSINTLKKTFSEYVSFLKDIHSLSIEELERNNPFLGKRAFSIKGGASCAKRVLESIDATDLVFSTYGLRYGTLLSGAIDETYLV
ncbi:MAG: hypothetical protein BM556_09945 [Bacteriovorax sp. MedPE-SWde]|nr:MAG: hypothetical protein BM556_09945 [Bacteriovorax sp. MedPE-SWde]